ncbi:glycoside hydrolase family 25 protein [Aureimonas frigidaquae]|uniref:glycoside hydrolase family 25 protein n=1 Tax=Aureimonas frigidaquae TaxID=424757 RepID=UPI0007845358|nr:glycoside hydrolase family 25 protein [Aureimonas frigidaquae]
MRKPGAALKAAMRWTAAVAASLMVASAVPASAAWNQPWKSEDRALVIDAYEFNPIDWAELTSDKRIAGFINKASDGMPPAWSCRGLSGDDANLCKNRWWKYSVTRELYQTRRAMAKQLGLKWGAYHLARPGNPREQADHFLDFAEPSDDDLIALDIEDISPEWMSLSDAEIFAEQIRIRTGRYPVLYTNGNTAAYIDKNADAYPLLSRLPLWYARYRDDITGLFPETSWPQYALWQFSSMHNCSERSCPYRVKGAQTDIDVNVSPLSVAELRAAWPFRELVRELPADAGTLTAARGTAGEGLMVNAFGPSGQPQHRDPLAMLTEVARQEHAGQPRQPVLSSLTRAPKVDPDMPGDGHVTDPVSAIAKSFAQLGRKMQRVVEVLSEDDEPALVPMRGAFRHPTKDGAVTPVAAPRIPTEARSFIIEQMEKSRAVNGATGQDGAAAAALDGALALADTGRERGGRPSGAATALEAMAQSGGRVADAFALTQ